MKKTTKRLGSYRLKAVYTPDGWKGEIYQDWLGLEVRQAELAVFYKSSDLALTAAEEEVKRMEVVSQLQTLFGEWCDKGLVSSTEKIHLFKSVQ
jgi:hypothetical protein